MIQKTAIKDFLELATTYPVLDVRSPGEFDHAHIPGAHSFPLFDDEERRIVGTKYKQQSRETAIKQGLEFFGPKMRPMIDQAEAILQHHGQGQKLLVHCWRGGMRSAGVAWLLDLYGFEVYTLAGGYKAYRNFVLQQFEKAYQLKILGGYTGSGKTDLLRQLEREGNAVIDLEGLAQHKGSAFGNLAQAAQPSQEMFENLLASALIKNADKPTWIEDESQRIGNINLPNNFFRQKQASPLCFLDIPFEKRLDYLTTEYGSFDREKLVNAIIRIKKRLGGLETKTAVNYLHEDDTRNCFAILLKYYDKGYLKSLHGRNEPQQPVLKIETGCVDAVHNCRLVNAAFNTIQKK